MDNNQVAPAETLPVVAYRIFDGEGGFDFIEDEPEEFSVKWAARYGRKYEPLADHAQATAEISLLKGMLETDEQIIGTLRAQLQEAEKALRFYSNPEAYKPDSVGRVPDVTYVAEAALCSLHPTQGKPTPE